MIAALIFVISMAAAVQFVVFSWRAALLSIAAKPLSETGHRAIDLVAGCLEPEDFRAVSALHQVCPDLTSAKNRKMWHVRAYYRTLEFVQSVSHAVLPAFSAWSLREMSACTRYAAVVVDQHLQHNRACIAELHSF